MKECNFIDGEWQETENSFESFNPATGEKVGEFPDSGREEINRAVQAAHEAQEEWEDTPAPERGSILLEASKIVEERKDEMAEKLTEEEGKTIAEATGEVQRVVDLFSYYASKARDIGGVNKSASSRTKKIYTKKEPMGVAGLITPWNYPVAIPAWKIAPALITGNTVVLKPSELAPGIVSELVEVLEEAGVPDGVVNLVHGKAEPGSALVEHEKVDTISFTGSKAVGDKVYKQASEDQKKTQLEMGGKNPCLVMEDADVEKAAEIVKNGAFGVTGQACTATSRAIVHEEVHDKFVEKIVEKVEEIEVGNGKEAEMGPQVTVEEMEATLEYIEKGKQEGGNLETGGQKLDREGNFVEPTVFTGVDPDDTIAQEEIFGPVLAVIKVSSFEEAIKVANNVEYGLSASIVTDSHSRANRFIDEIEAGLVKVNEKTTGVELQLPFGGMKASSSETFREQGDAGIDFFTISKTVYENY